MQKCFWRRKMLLRVLVCLVVMAGMPGLFCFGMVTITRRGVSPGKDSVCSVRTH